MATSSSPTPLASGHACKHANAAKGPRCPIRPVWGTEWPHAVVPVGRLSPPCLGLMHWRTSWLVRRHARAPGKRDRSFNAISAAAPAPSECPVSTRSQPCTRRIGPASFHASHSMPGTCAYVAGSLHDSTPRQCAYPDQPVSCRHSSACLLNSEPALAPRPVAMQSTPAASWQNGRGWSGGTFT